MLSVCLLGATAKAQVVTYTFSQSNVPYIGLPASANLPASPPGSKYHIALPFTFSLDTMSADSIWIHLNGFAALRKKMPYSYSDGRGVLYDTAEFYGVMAPFNRSSGDLSGTVRTTTQGTAPNRTFVIEWFNMAAYKSPGFYYTTFQLRLHETTNIIDFAYGTVTIPTNISYDFIRVGLRGYSNSKLIGDVTQRFTFTDWSATVASVPAANDFGCEVSGNPIVKPDSSLCYTWTPPVACANGGLSVSVPDSLYTCMNSATSITATISPVSGGLSYQWQQSADNISWADVPGLFYTTYPTPAIIAPVYYRLKLVCTSSADSFFSNVCKVQPYPGLPTPYYENFDSLATDGLIPQCMIPDGWESFTDPQTAHSGPMFLYLDANGPRPTLITQGIQLSAGINYRMSYWYLGQNPYPVNDTLKATIGRFPSKDSLSLITPGSFVIDTDNTEKFRRADYYFTVPTSGSYYFGIGLHTSNSSPFGYGIDDITVMEVPQKDVLVDTIVSPYPFEPLCLTSQSLVTVRVKNAGQQAVTNIPVYYRRNSTTYGPDTIASLNPGQSVNHTFSQTTNLSGNNTTYTVKAWTKLTGDTYKANDTVWSTVLHTDPVFPVPYTMDWSSSTYGTLYGTDWTEDTEEYSTIGQVYSGGTRNLYSSAIGYNFYGDSFFAKLQAPPVGPVDDHAFITFDYRMVNYAGNTPATLSVGDTIFVVASDDCGATFDTLYQLHGGNQVTDEQFHTISPLYIGMFAGSKVTIELWMKHASTSSVTAFFDMDNFKVDIMPLTEIKVNSMPETGGYACVGSTIPVKVALENAAGLPAIGFQIMADVNGQPGVISYTYTGNLPFGKKDTVTIGNVTIGNAGIQELTAYTVIPGDENMLNDTAFKTIQIPATPAAPQIAADTVCSGTMTNLGYVLPDSLTHFWYSSPTATTPYYKENIYTTPVLSSPATYYAETVTVQDGKAGKLDFTSSSSGFLSTGYGLILNAETDLTIDSMSIYPYGTGSVTVKILSCASCSNPTIMGTFTYNFNSIYWVKQKVAVGAFLPQGQGYFMKIESINGLSDLRRDFPFSGYPVVQNSPLTVASGYGNNMAQYDGYYYFYDMVVKGFGCHSTRVAIPVNVAPAAQPSFTALLAGSDLTVSNTSAGGGSYLWDFSDGATSADMQPAPHTYLQDGTYTVTLTQANSCDTVQTQQTITVSTNGIAEVEANGFTVYPNPAKDYIIIESPTNMSGTTFKIANTLGFIIQEGTLQQRQTKLNLPNLAAGVYHLHIASKEGRTFKIIVR